MLLLSSRPPLHLLQPKLPIHTTSANIHLLLRSVAALVLVLYLEVVARSPGEILGPAVRLVVEECSEVKVVGLQGEEVDEGDFTRQGEDPGLAPRLLAPARITICMTWECKRSGKLYSTC